MPAEEQRKAPAVLARVTEWLRTGTHQQRIVAADVVREVTRPGRAHPGEAGNDSAVAAWRAILADSESGVAHDAVRGWLHFALDPTTRAPVLEVLLAAAGNEVRALDLLSVATHLWPREDPGARGDVHDELERQIRPRHPAVPR